MNSPLRVLIIEDNDDDRLLLLRTLRQGGYEPVYQCVQTAAALTAALSDETWDIVLSDYRLPQLNGSEALSMVQKSGLDLPFIVVSGVIGEEQAVAVMKAGAHDYVLKGKLIRLCPAIARELREAEERRQRREAESQLRASEAQFRLLFEANPNPMWVFDEETLRFLAVNAAALHHYGYTRDEFLALTVMDIRPAEAREQARAAIAAQTGLSETLIGVCVHQKKDGTLIDAEITASSIPFSGRPARIVLANDVTARLAAERELERRRRREELLADTAQRLLAAAEPLQVVDELCAEVMHFIECDVFFNYVVDDMAGRLRLNACAGIPASEAARIEWLDYGIAVCGCVARDGKRVVIEDIPHANDPRTDLVASYGVLAYCCHPLRSHGQVLGTLSFGTRRRRTFSRDEIALLSAVSELVALAIQRLRDLAVLRESREDLNRAQSVAHVGSWRLNILRDELLWSDENWRIFGLPKGTALTYETFLSTIHPDDRAYVNERWTAALRGEPYDVEHRILVNDTVKWVRERAELEFDADGTLLGGFGTTQDITERKNAEAVQARYELIAQCARDPLLLIDLEGNIIEVNQAAVKLYGYTREELHNLRIHGLRQEDAEVVDLQMLQAKATGILFESIHVRKDGSTVPVEISSRGVTIDGKDMLLSVIRDISQRKETELTLRRARDEAERASQVKSEFLAAMSHELRTPLNAIMGFSQVLGNEYFGPLSDKQKEYAADIYDSGKHLLSLINDILDLSKIEAGKMEPNWSSVDVDSLLEHSSLLVREKCFKHGIRLEIELAESVRGLKITADERRFNQILYNLLSNATKFTPDGGSIRVAARLKEEPAPLLEVSIADTGIGIAPEHQTHIFEAFYQVCGGTVDKTPGTGLGLCLVKQLVAMHGGNIWVESEGEGHGSRFTFFVPLDARSATRDQPEVKLS